MNKLKIGLIGLGTVGCGVYKTIQNIDNVEIVKIAVKNINKPRSVEVPREMLTDNPYDVVNDPSIDVVVELIGGVEPAYDYISTAIKMANILLLQIKNSLPKEEKNCLFYQKNITELFFTKLQLQAVYQL